MRQMNQPDSLIDHVHNLQRSQETNEDGKASNETPRELRTHVQLPIVKRKPTVVSHQNGLQALDGHIYDQEVNSEQQQENHPPLDGAELSKDELNSTTPSPGDNRELSIKPRRDSRTIKDLPRCFECHMELTGKFVRALGNTYHLDCLVCKVDYCFTDKKALSFR